MRAASPKFVNVPHKVKSLIFTVFSLRGWLTALIAVFCLSVYELLQKYIIGIISADVLIIIRGLVSFLFILSASKNFPSTHYVRLRDFKQNFSFLQFARAGASTLCGLVLSFGIVLSPNQLRAYTFFLLHPAWTIFIAPYLTPKRVTQSLPKIGERDFWKFGRLFPVFLSVIGILIYALLSKTVAESPPALHNADVRSCEFQQQLDTGLKTFLGYTASGVAGFLFSITNLLTTKISKDEGTSSTLTSSFTFILGAGMLLVISIALSYSSQGHSAFFLCFGGGPVSRTVAISVCIMISLLAAIGAVLFAEAFSKPSENQSIIAAMDLTAVFWAAFFGLLLSGWENIGLIMMLAGILFCIILENEPYTPKDET